MKRQRISCVSWEPGSGSKESGSPWVPLRFWWVSCDLHTDAGWLVISWRNDVVGSETAWSNRRLIMLELRVFVSLPLSIVQFIILPLLLLIICSCILLMAGHPLLLLLIQVIPSCWPCIILCADPNWCPNLLTKSVTVFNHFYNHNEIFIIFIKKKL